jgi:hypothetical protein
VDGERLGAVHEAEGPDESRDAQDVVGVVVREKDLSQAEADPVPHHLSLGPFAAVEQQHLALAVDRERRDVALHGGRGGAGAEKRGGEHGEEGRRVDGWTGTLLAVPAYSP